MQTVSSNKREKSLNEKKPRIEKVASSVASLLQLHTLSKYYSVKKIVSHRHRTSYIFVSLILGEIQDKNEENLSFTSSEIVKYTLLVFSPFRSEIFPMTFAVGLYCKYIVNIFPGGQGISPASLAMHVGLGNQPPPFVSALHPTHYFSSFSGFGNGMGGE